MEIKLTQDKIAIIDDEDFSLISLYKWHYHKHSDKYGGYAATSVNKIRIYMHKLILNVGKEHTVDHINHNKLDNRKINLRKCSQSENNKNKPKIKRNTSSKFKGVYFDKYSNSWKAQISINNHTTHIGRFKNEIEAAKAYNEACKKHYGEFANLNIIN